jgi:large subunit ribosomal protein L29
MKIAEIKELTVEELKKKVEDLRRELMLSRIAKAKQQLKNPLKIRFLRRDIARVLTLLHQKGVK